MICDHLRGTAVYSGLGGRFATLFGFLRSNDLNTYPDGLHEIDGQNLYLTIKSYQPRPLEKAVWETHENYADMQLLLEGRELMGVAPAYRLTVKQPYDSERDVTFYHSIDSGYFVLLTPGMFTILFPQDAHLPSLSDGNASHNRKAVIKIRLI